jgi:hypothetical protein
MTIAAPVAGECAVHAGTSADWACQRCGSFVCKACERRTRPEAPPLCPKCWELRSQVVQEQTVTESKRLQVAGLVLGILSFLHPLLMVGSLVLNIRELVRGTGGTNRWMNVAGVSLTGVAVLTWAGFIVFAVTR